MRWHIAVLAGLTFGIAHAEQCLVDHCHDGDTCTLRCGVRSDVTRRIKVRLHCIDAPEIGQVPWGKRSAQALRRFAPAGAQVELETLKADRYGRTVGVLRLNNANLNLEMVRQGFAVVYEKYCTEPVYYQAQEEARAARWGIWSQPGVQQRPWEWRHGKVGFIPLPKPILLVSYDICVSRTVTIYGGILRCRRTREKCEPTQFGSLVGGANLTVPLLVEKLAFLELENIGLIYKDERCNCS